MPKLPKIIFSLQYLKEELSGEVDFLHEDKHKSLLQIDIMILIGMAKHSQSFQNRKFVMSLLYLKKEVKDEVDFLHADKHQSLPKVSILWTSKFPTRLISLLMGMIKHSQITQSNKFATSLRYLKKEGRNGR